MGGEVGGLIFGVVAGQGLRCWWRWFWLYDVNDTVDLVVGGLIGHFDWYQP